LQVRRKIWPKLLGINPYSIDGNAFRAYANRGHKDYSTVAQDVLRSAWIRTRTENSGTAKVTQNKSEAKKSESSLKVTECSQNVQ
jgi:hypothetical protein